MRRQTYSLFIVISFFAITTTVRAAVPTSVNVQGRLTDASGVPLPTGTKTLTFKIFSDSAAGIEVWPAGPGETQTVASDADGLWSTRVGALVPLTDPVFSDSSRWLEITVDDGVNPPETMPRVRLVTGPYAYRVSTVDGASGGNITTKLTVGPGHTNPGLGAFAVGAFNNASGSRASVTGGNNNTAEGDNAAIAGGESNEAQGNNSFIGSGNENHANNTYSAVVSGETNDASGEYAFIGSGITNQAISTGSIVVGGDGNTSSGLRAVVVGGLFNEASGDHSTLGGGESNTASNNFTTVSGGISNVASGLRSVIGGGFDNEAIGMASSISGGDSNYAVADFTTVGGGRNNRAIGAFAVVGGGGAAGFFDGNNANGDYSVVGGGSRNVTNGAQSTIGGGSGNSTAGDFGTIGGGNSNFTNQWYSTVGGGVSNNASHWTSTVSGGGFNEAADTGATVGGGENNYARGRFSVICGGGSRLSADSNSISAFGDFSTLGGGNRNVITGDGCFLGGGYENRVSGTASTIAGGIFNIVSNGIATVGGGQANHADGRFSTIPGGSGNFAGGSYSFAAGHRAKASHSGSFVWGDNTEADFSSTSEDQFLIRASGNVGINTADPQATLDIQSVFGDGQELLRFTMERAWAFRQVGSGLNTSLELKSLVDGNTKHFVVTTDGGVGIGTTLPAYKLDVQGDIGGTGGLYHSSDARFKGDVHAIESALSRIGRLRGVSFTWRNEDYPERNFPEGKRIGLIAQDVEKVVPEVVRTADDGYKSVDYSRLVAVLIEAVKEQQVQIDELKSEMEQMKQ